MEKNVLYPNVRYMYKLFLATLLLGVLVTAFGGWMGYLIGRDEGGASGASTGLRIGTLANLVWILPILAIIPPYYRSLRYEILQNEIIVHVGVITKSVKHVPFRTVTNLKLKQDPFDRLFGLGTLNVQTAGMSGQTGAEESLVGLPNFEQVYDQVAKAIRRFRGAMAPTQAEEEDTLSEAEVFSAMLSELRAIRDLLEHS